MWRRSAPSIVFLLVGLISAFHPTFLSAFRMMQTDPGDTRLNNFIFEHSYRWVVGWITFQPIRLWDQPIFFPTPNVGAYSDVLLGSAPIYWAFRALRFAPDTSLQLWMIVVLTADFLTMDLFLRRCLGMRPFASAAGGFLFAFAGPRIAQLGHQQLLPQFFTILAFYGLYRFYQPRRLTSAQGVSLFCICAVAQIWAGYYLGWFFFLGIVALAFAALCSRVERARQLQSFISHRTAIVLATGIALALIAPFAHHAIQALHQLGGRAFRDVEPLVPRPQSWLHLGPFSWMYSWQERYRIFNRLPLGHEHALGLGWCTLCLAARGGHLFARHRGGWAKFAMIAAVAIMLLMMRYPGGFIPWKLLFKVIPAGNTIRGVSRVVVLLLVPMSIGFAWLVETRKRSASAAALALICVLEQGHTTPAYDKLAIRQDVTGLVRLISRDCVAFYYSPAFPANALVVPATYKLQMDAAWASMESGVPTINGYSGNAPRGWRDLQDNEIMSELDFERLRNSLIAWATTHHLDLRKVCWIGPPSVRALLAP